MPEAALTLLPQCEPSAQTIKLSSLTADSLEPTGCKPDSRRTRDYDNDAYHKLNPFTGYTGRDSAAVLWSTETVAFHTEDMSDLYSPSATCPHFPPCYSFWCCLTPAA